MVNEVRDCSTNLIGRGGAGPAGVVFHHPVLTAKPLFEIFRALIIEFINFSSDMIKPEDRDRDTFAGVLKTIATEYEKLVAIRNTLLHGTWFIGYSTAEDPNSENFFFNKFKPTKTGLEREDAPKHAVELLALKDRCEDARNWIAFIHSCVPRIDRPYDRVADRFFFNNGEWQLSINANSSPETLPRKSRE